MMTLQTMDAYLSHYAAETPHAEAAIEDSTRLTYAELETEVDQASAYLRKQGIGAGDRVAIGALPGLIYYIGLLAISRIGAIYVGINPRYTSPEIAHVLKLTEPALILIDARSSDQQVKNITSAKADGRVHAIETLEMMRGAGVYGAPSPATREDVAVIVFTSGSTGQPKGAALHHGGLIEAAKAQSALSDHWDDDAQPRYLSNLPTNHVGAIMNLTLASLVRGGALVFQAKFDPLETLDLIQREHITTWLQVPAMFTLCVQLPSFAKTRLPDLRTIGIGGGPVSSKTLSALRKLGADIFVEYGQTETMSSLTWTAKTEPDEVLLNTVGRFDPRIEARISDADGNAVAQGDIGEVQARGDCTLRSYWNDATATQEVFTDDGWLHTGDLGMQRSDGRIVLIGRSREMIKSGGYNVYPREIEQVLETHVEVAEVVVFGVDDEVYVERVEAAIELRSARDDADIAALEALCREKLAGYKLPRRFHIVKALPRLPNGKIDRTATQKMFA